MSKSMSLTPEQTIYLASHNRHKAQELQAMSQGLVNIRSLSEVAPEVTWHENGSTYLENARIKAHAVRTHTSSAVLADDSGLEVDALGGHPGVNSSHYGGHEGDHLGNTLALLEALKNVPKKQRTAKFVCTLLYIDPEGCESIFTGECSGQIAFKPEGAKGFGYDPIFITDDFGLAMALLTDEQKNTISHRSRAFGQFIRFLSTNKL